MRNTAIAAAAALGACAFAMTAGCRQDGQEQSDRNRSDLRAQSEGRLRVDQSAVLPVDVRAGVQRAYPGATVQNVTKKTLEDRKVSYEIDLTTRDGRRLTRAFDDKGQPLKG